jgi:hypothetical protein
MVFMAESRGDPLRHLGRNGSFQHWRVGWSDSEGARFEVERGPGEDTTEEGKIKRDSSLPELRS